MIFNQLSKGSNVYVDTNFVVYLLEGNGTFQEKSKKLFEHLIKQQTNIISSELTYMEVMVRPFKEHNQSLITKYDYLFERFISLKPISMNVLKQATQYRAYTIPKQKTPDAIQVATAIEYQADWFISADKGIKNLPTSIQFYTIN